MNVRITSEWVAGLRRDVQAWDARAEKEGEEIARWKHWRWPDMMPPLKYAGPSAELGPGGRKRRASTGMAMGSGRHPPSTVYSVEASRLVPTQMTMPVHVWAMLSQGREAESVDVLRNIDSGDERLKGVQWRERWQEWDGEQHRSWRDRKGKPRARQWQEWQVQRMEWIKTGGVWRGTWRWEEYDRDKEWNRSRRRRRVGDGKDRLLVASNEAWESVPQEVLLGMVRAIEEWTIGLSKARVLAAAGLVCRAWLAICAPELYRWIHVRSSHIKQLIEAVSKPGSRIVPHAKYLKIRGLIPCLALPRLLPLLPHLGMLEINGIPEMSRTAYNPSTLRLASTILSASRTTLALSRLYFSEQQFSSTADVLCLLASCRPLISLTFYGCTIRTASSTCPLVTSTHLQSVDLSRDRGSIRDGAIASLALWWRWPQAQTDTTPTTTPYPGLDQVDARGVFAVMRSIAYDIMKWDRASLSLHDSWITNSWVLLATIQMGTFPANCMELELHVMRSADAADRKAAVDQIVIRFNTLEPRVRELPYGDVLARMDRPTTLLPHLRSVTLETPDADGHARLAGKLARLRSSGMLHLRTCREAQQVAQAAKLHPSGYSEDQGAVSPLWVTDEFQFEVSRVRWLELADENPK